MVNWRKKEDDIPNDRLGKHRIDRVCNLPSQQQLGDEEKRHPIAKEHEIQHQQLQKQTQRQQKSVTPKNGGTVKTGKNHHVSGTWPAWHDACRQRQLNNVINKSDRQFTYC